MAMTPNGLRFDPNARSGHVESFFLKAVDPSGKRALWLKATVFASPSAPAGPLAEAWAIAFERKGDDRRRVAVKASMPFAEASFGREQLDVRLGGSAAAPRLSMEPGRTTGALELRDRSIEWDLSYLGDERPIRPLPFAFMYEAPLPKSKLLTPVPDAVFSGELRVDRERWPVEAWKGMQGHNWGTGHAELYAWCHANAWDEDPEFVLEGLSARVRVGPILSPMTTIVAVRHRGVAYDFNQPMDLLRARGDVTLRRWSFAATSKHARIEGVVEADARDMVGLYYPNPSGPMTYCLNSKLAQARVRFEAHGRPPLTLTSRAAALEIGTHDPAHGVEMMA
jgi:hypothetical protein